MEKTGKPSLSDKPMPVVQQPEPERNLLVWNAAERLYKKRDREYYTTVGVIVLLLSVILLFAKEFLLVGVILSLGFVSYVLASVPPGKIKHRVTNKGIRTGKKLYRWNALGRFWFETKWKQTVLNIESLFGFPGKLVMVMDEKDKKHINETLSKYLVKEKPLPTLLDKAAKWIQEKVPLETE